VLRLGRTGSAVLRLVAFVERPGAMIPWWADLRARERPMGKAASGVLYAAAMVAVVVGVDLMFFRSKTWFWERLAANVGIALLFGALYFRFGRSP
jgi:membrane associated rhomboid family serine protease